MQFLWCFWFKSHFVTWLGHSNISHTLLRPYSWTVHVVRPVTVNAGMNKKQLGCCFVICSTVRRLLWECCLFCVISVETALFACQHHQREMVQGVETGSFLWINLGCLRLCCGASILSKKGKVFPILITERWAWSWSRCTGSQPAGGVKWITA